MKKTIIILAILLTSITAQAADVPCTVVIPDLWVSSVMDYTVDRYMFPGTPYCPGLDPELPAQVKRCFIKMELREKPAQNVREWVEKQRTDAKLAEVEPAPVVIDEE